MVGVSPDGEGLRAAAAVVVAVMPATAWGSPAGLSAALASVATGDTIWAGLVATPADPGALGPPVGQYSSR